MRIVVQMLFACLKYESSCLAVRNDRMPNGDMQGTTDERMNQKGLKSS